MMAMRAHKFIRVGATSLALGFSILVAACGHPANGQPVLTGGGATPSTSCGDSSHALGWTGSAYNCQGITGSAAAGGSNTQVQYNNSAALAGISGVTSDGTLMTFANSDIRLIGSSTGYTIFTSDNANTSNFTLHFPPANDTLAAIAATQTLTNKTISGSANTLSNIANASLSNSTISGIALGNSLAALTATDTTLTFSGSYSGGTARTVGLNLGNTNNWTALQSVAVTTLNISTATFTPTGASNNYKITLTSACTCTIANPSATPVAGTSGVFEIIQYSGGAKTLTWGTQYYAAGGSVAVQPDTAANGLNLINYYVADATHIYINIGAANATH